MLRWSLILLIAGPIWAATSQPGTMPATRPATSPTTAPAIEALSASDTLLVEHYDFDFERDSKRLRDLKAAAPSAGPDGTIAQTLPTLSEQITSQLSKGSTRLRAAPSLDTLTQQQNIWQEFATELTDWKARTRGELDRLVVNDAKSVDEQNGWKYTQQLRGVVDNPARVKDINGLIGLIGEVRERYAAPTQRTRDLLDQIDELSERVTAFQQRLENARAEAVSKLFDRDCPPLWEVGELRKSEAASAGSYDSLENQWTELKAYAIDNSDSFVLHGGLIIALVLASRWLGRRSDAWMAQEKDLDRSLGLLKMPLAVGLAFSLLIAAWIYPLPPHLLWVIFGTATLLPLYLLLRQVLEPRILPLARLMLLLWLFNTILGLLPGGGLITRLLLAGEAGGGALLLSSFAVYTLRVKQTTSAEGQWLRQFLSTLTRMIVVLLIASLLSNLFGRFNLARLLINSLLVSSFIAIIIIVGTNVAIALLTGAFHVWPLHELHLVREHRATMQSRSRWLISALGVVLWITLTMRTLAIREAVLAAFYSIVDARFLGENGPSLHDIFDFAFTVTAAFLISRFVRFVLREDVYPRVRLARGVPYAISTLLHYCILLIGLWLAFAEMHVEQTKFTILVSAFGVGIGFGLQNVVNNFVSGLLLLFERPVQVGDVVELDGGYIGSVSTIGIRASIIRTQDAAEIIVPNSLLISNRVINWTFSTRQRAFTLPITINPGPDPAKMLDVLLEAASKTRLILQSPSPQAYLVEFSPGVGVKFEVRVWTSQFEDWIAARSDLALSISAGCTAAGITIK